VSNRFAKLSFALAFAIGATALAVAPIRAAFSIAITPSILELEGEAGSDGRVEVSVTNSGDETFDVALTTSQYRDMDGERSAVDWITVRPRRMRVQPGDTRSVEIRLRIPDEIASGGRYALVRFTTLPPPSSAAGDIAISGAVAVPILLAVRGDGPLTGDPGIERFAPLVEADGRLGFRAQIRNDGNVHTRVSGSVRVGLPSEEPHATLDIPDRLLLPGVATIVETHGTLPLSLDGRFHAMARFIPQRDGSRREFEAFVASVEFDATPQLSLLTGGVCENLDRGPTISGSMQNLGEVGLAPFVRFEILDGNGTPVAAADPPRSPLVWPGETLELSAELGRRLLSDSYTLRTTATFGAGSMVESETPFSIGGDPATAVPLCSTPTAGTN
jgi:hypothetical protein